VVRSGMIYEAFLGINCRFQGMKTETKFLLGLGVPESD
jgi:hypothetical protein